MKNLTNWNLFEENEQPTNLSARKDIISFIIWNHCGRMVFF